MTYAETAETVYDIYTRTLDLDMVCTRLKLSDVEVAKLKADKDFMLRIAIFESREQERLIQNMRELSQSSNESIKLSATVKLGTMLYEKRFRPPIVTNPRGDDEDGDDNCLTDEEKEQFRDNMSVFFND